ncbi:MAG: epoxyqueuosine reductase QueH [Candidatus Omnitrophota bacterium]
MKKLLLHICCANCAIYCTKRLRGMGYAVEGFFYNPNIHPLAEYSRRRDSLEKLEEEIGLKVLYFRDFIFEDYFRKISLNEDEHRCQLCWRLRLTQTAEYASEKGFDLFSTTLLISPYQDQEKIKLLGEELSGEFSVQFVFENFRKGFSQSQKESKEMGLYRQNYCGCIYSERDRYLKKEARSIKD